MSTQDGVPFRLGWKAVSLGKGFALSGSGHQEGKGNMDAKEAIALIEERFDLLETQSHYQVLGVERDASVADIRAAYRTLAKKFHADRFRAYMLNDGQQKKLEAVFNRLGKANSILTNEPRRAEYDNEIGASGVARERKVTADEMERIFGAEDALRRGKGMLQRGDIKGALAKFRVAFEVSADIPMSPPTTPSPAFSTERAPTAPTARRPSKSSKCWSGRTKTMSPRISSMPRRSSSRSRPMRRRSISIVFWRRSQTIPKRSVRFALQPVGVVTATRFRFTRST